MLAMAAACLALAGGWPVAAQGTCRANNLGTVTCPAPPPEPRPVLRARTQAIDNVRQRPGLGDAAPTVVPGWRTNSFGDTRVPRGAGGNCRSDSLGNLICF
jgi:hypothetical protein